MFYLSPSESEREDVLLLLENNDNEKEVKLKLGWHNIFNLRHKNKQGQGHLHLMHACKYVPVTVTRYTHVLNGK